MLKKVTLILFLFTMCCVQGKVLIFTHSYNRPEFIELQVKTFKAFLQDEYEFVVFNDASNDGMRQAIETTCAKVGVRCIRVPQHLHQNQGPGWRHMDCIRYSFEQIGFDHDGIVLMIDSDMFLIRPFSIEEYMKGYDLIGQKQWRYNDILQTTYLAPLLVFINMNTIPNKRTINFNGGYVEGLACDVGGQMYYYLKNNPQLKYRFYWGDSIQRLANNPDSVLCKNGFDNNTIDLVRLLGTTVFDFEIHGDGSFIHYRAGSNWIGYSDALVSEKNKHLYNFINAQLNYYKVKIEL